MQRLEVERLGVDDGSEVELAPVLVVDGDTVLATPGQLGGATVTAKVVGDGQGPEDRRLHLQAEDATTAAAGATARSYSVIEITAITPASAK